MKKLVVFLFFIALYSDAQMFKSFDDTQIHYEIMGKGRPVVLLHGFIVNSKSWKGGALPKKLTDAGFQVILVDLRGNGQSDKPHDLAKYENDAEIRDVIELMKFLGIMEYDIVGYSRGSILAAKMISMDKHIKTVTLGGMGADFTSPNWYRKKNFEEIFTGKAHLYPEFQGAVDYAKSSGADTLVLGLLQKAQPMTTFKEMKKFKKPVLVISGSEDTDNGKAEDLAKIFTNATLKIVPGKNHNNASSSEGFAEDVLQFLKAN
jgi:pimeloyl-ACP methyl ester carboxylesterase